MQGREEERHEDTKEDFEAVGMRDAAVVVVDTRDGEPCGECRECDKACDLRRI